MGTPDDRASGYWDESNRELVELIRQRIERVGRITFAQFMELVLYQPEHGYYQSGRPRAGRSGDFITAPEADPLFGQAIACQLEELWERLRHPETFTLREYGAGSGSLILGICERLQLDRHPLLDRLCYQPIEINPARREEISDRLAGIGLARILSDQSEEPITGCVLANEFVDALPVHRISRTEDGLLECYVVWRDGWFQDELGPLSTPAIAARLEAEAIELRPGQTAEVCLESDAWMLEVSKKLARGYALVIDYGYPADELYGERFPDGSLRAYYQHGVHDDPYRGVGYQDLTAHVDFTALIRTAGQQGLATLGLTTQANFLAGAGLGELLVDLQSQPGMTSERYLAARSAVYRMIDPGAMGRFRVLFLGRDLDGSGNVPLSGLTVTI
ncbi:MAG TPA: SAM-dependent methyltransferase [Thermomicrobiaceae bacterium]|nr:SAM-dependent methyltransferase [Thermomicrobiaceae bacterium]